jgi:chemotaxis protein MotB
MQSSGLQAGQVSQVRGFADQQPRVKLSPEDPSNRRISLIVQYLDKALSEDGAAKEIPGENGKDSASKSTGR